METFIKQYTRHVLASFDFKPNNEQMCFFNEFFQLIQSNEKNRCLILKGYAGTGKTSCVAQLVKSLHYFNKKVNLLAPTGRAAKVFSSYSNKPANTIHKRIYRKQKIENGQIRLVLAPNLSKNSIFFVDEASMIGEYNEKELHRNLLEDLLQFVFSDPSSILILIGDDAQLPPVQSDYSPALDVAYLNLNFPQLSCKICELTEVHRQKDGGDIILNATQLRQYNNKFKLSLLPKSEIELLDGLSFGEKLEESYSTHSIEESIIVTRSNKRANAYNQEIRKRILFYEDEINSGDIIMCVKNNYFWVEETSDAGFIANGESLKIHRILKREELYGFHFLHAEVSLLSYEEMGRFPVIILLDSLYSEEASLPREDMKRLFFEVEKDYSDEGNKKTRYEKILANPHFNALQIKFSYAITCHKSQGGQWEHVFIDHGYVEEFHEKAFYRWLYTAFTRAKSKLFLVNFSEELQ